jgi:hypothetical protein
MFDKVEYSFIPTSFTGLANLAQYLLNNGYSYIHSGSILNIINAIYYQAQNLIRRLKIRDLNLLIIFF